MRKINWPKGIEWRNRRLLVTRSLNRGREIMRKSSALFPTIYQRDDGTTALDGRTPCRPNLTWCPPGSISPALVGLE